MSEQSDHNFLVDKYGTEDEEVVLPRSLFDYIVYNLDDSNKTNPCKILSTYKLKPLSINEDLSKKTHFYWMSGSAFKLALDNYPEIIQSQHACGPGNTYKYIKKYIKDDNLNILLGYEDALGIVERSGEDDENL